VVTHVYEVIEVLWPVCGITQKRTCLYVKKQKLMEGSLMSVDTAEVTQINSIYFASIIILNILFPQNTNHFLEI